MDEPDFLAQRFEENRRALLGLAYRMLGSREEAEDAVQEAWLRIARIDAPEVRNLSGLLRTITSRVCLDQLRSRRARPEECAGNLPATCAARTGPGPEQEVVEADSVSRALLIVLDTLSPAERVAFVLHDTFGVPFSEIGAVLGRTPTTAKKLASRARVKVRGPRSRRPVELARHREVVGAFLAAARSGDTRTIAACLAPDVVRTADAAALSGDRPARLRGVESVAREISWFGDAPEAEVAMVDGDVGLLVAPRGRPWLAARFSIADGRVAGYELIADPVRLRGLGIRPLPQDLTRRRLRVNRAERTE
jgi:RNA polymerase sigma-70 factor (ECF subfamily)